MMARGAGASGWGGSSDRGGAKGRREQYGDGGKSLDSELIRRADDFSLFDAGSATKREYDANIKKIKQSNLTEKEKTDAVDKLHRLTTEQLKSQTKVANPYVSGVARFNQKQVQKAADSTAQKGKMSILSCETCKKSLPQIKKRQKQNPFPLRLALQWTAAR